MRRRPASLLLAFCAAVLLLSAAVASKQPQSHSNDERQTAALATECNTTPQVVTNLMGAAAVACAECLTAHKVTGFCRKECAAVPVGRESFRPLPLLPIVPVCLNGTLCTPGSPAACQCCGENLGMGYNIAPSTKRNARVGPLANFRKGCDLPVVANNCPTCTLWRKLRGNYLQGPLTSLSCKEDNVDRCFPTSDKKHTFMGTFLDDPARYLLLPASKTADWPVIGVEDRKVLSRKVEEIWDLAWGLAFKPYENLLSKPFGSVADLPLSNKSCNIGMAINPASSRSQHQMHIHVSLVPTPLRNLLVGRDKNYGTWTKVRIPITRRDQVEWPSAYARYFSLPSPKHGKKQAGPSMYRIFNQAFSMANRDWLYLQAWGIMIIPDEETIDLCKSDAPHPRGFYLLLASNNQLGSWNPYRGTPQANSLWQPGNILCNSFSTGAGAFWTLQECYGNSAIQAAAAAKAGDIDWSDKLVQLQLAQDGLL